MKFLLANFFSSNWFLIIILLVAVGLMIFTSFSRRKKEETYRNELDSKIVAGAKVKTYNGLYGTVVSVRSTTDGKIVLLETGEGDKKSYQQIHINAIYGIDESEDMVIDAEGNEVPLSELNKPKEVEEVKEETKATETEVEKNVEEVVEENLVTDETEDKKEKKSAKKADK